MGLPSTLLAGGPQALLGGPFFGPGFGLKDLAKKWSGFVMSFPRFAGFPGLATPGGTETGETPQKPKIVDFAMSALFAKAISKKALWIS